MGPASKLNSVKKYVVSSNLKKADWNNTTIINKNIMEQIAALKNQPGTEIQIGGSARLVTSLLKNNLIDEFRFLIHPSIAGSGKHFFNDDMKINSLKLITTQTLEKGVVALHYETI
jgi:dihydrofolate reductase